jgi:hypothetical protein
MCPPLKIDLKNINKHEPAREPVTEPIFEPNLKPHPWLDPLSSLSLTRHGYSECHAPINPPPPQKVATSSVMVASSLDLLGRAGPQSGHTTSNHQGSFNLHS